MTEKHSNIFSFVLFVAAMVLSLVLVFYFLNDPIGLVVGLMLFAFSLSMVLVVTNEKWWKQR